MEFQPFSGLVAIDLYPSLSDVSGLSISKSLSSKTPISLSSLSDSVSFFAFGFGLFPAFHSGYFSGHHSTFGLRRVSSVFLVGAFSFKEKSPTITVASFFFFFFRQTTELIAYVPLFTETDKFTQAKFHQCKLTAKGPPFRFLPFLRNLQNRKTPKGPPFQFFWHCANFFSQIFNISKECPLRIF